MPRYLKVGASAEVRTETARNVRDTVEAILADIEARGDAAVRDLLIKFDDWDRESYRLTDSEIQVCMAFEVDEVGAAKSRGVFNSVFVPGELDFAPSVHAA